MSLFNRNEFVGLEGIDPYQFGENDPKTDALAIVQETYNRLALEETHPWHASDADLLRLSLAGVAYAQDRTAEWLRNSGVVETRHGLRTTPDIADFAGELSQTSQDRLRLAQSIQPGDPEEYFTEDSIISLQAENMMPVWPLHPKGANRETPDWQYRSDDDDRAYRYVSDAFLKGIIESARELEAYADHGMRTVLAANGDEVPSEYSAMQEVLQSNFFEPHSAQLEQAYLATENIANLTATQKADLYNTAHDSFIAMMTTYVAVLAPVTLGESFRAQRL
jgi:hypothetical protein